MISLGMKFAMMYFLVKSVKLKFCMIQMSNRQANTIVLNHVVWEILYVRTKEFVCLISNNHKNFQTLVFAS